MDTFIGLNVQEWGYIALVANGLSVTVQMATLLRTREAQSFSMPFIFLMLLLNAWYCFVAYLQENVGFALATLSFVIYNSTVIYFHYCGKGGHGSLVCKRA